MFADFILDENKYSINKIEKNLFSENANRENINMTLYVHDKIFNFPSFVLRDKKSNESLQNLISSCEWQGVDGLPRPLSQRWLREQSTVVRANQCETTSFQLGDLNHLSKGDVLLKINLIDGRTHSLKINLILSTHLRITTNTPIPSVPDYLKSPAPKSVQKPPAMNSNGWLAFDFGTSNSTVTIYDSTRRNIAQVIPIESFQILQQEIKNLIMETFQEHSEVIASEWARFLREIKESVDLDQTLDSILQQASYSSPGNLFKLLYFIELKSFRCTDELKNIIYPRIQDIYTKMTSAPSLIARRIFVAHLDPADKTANVISSDIQILSTSPLSIEVGPRVLNARQQALNSDKHIDGEFHSSIKSFLFSPSSFDDVETSDEIDMTSGEYINVSDASGAAATIKRSDLLKETLKTLKIKSENWNSSREGRGDKSEPFNELVITYPTIAPPSARSKLKKIAKDVGFKHVYMDYDEATAAALFYIIKDYDPSSKRGLSALKSRSRRDGNQFYQHLVILDIGGGTTDVARLKLSIHEENPFKPGEDRGAGGTYHVLTPKLEASTGELQLGGDLLTLKTFQLIKALICDSLLINMKSQKNLVTTLATLPDNFKDKDAYKPRSLVDELIRTNDENLGSIITYMNQILPTNWKNKSLQEQRACRNIFYQIWDLADNAKRKLGQKAPYVEVPGHIISSMILGLEDSFSQLSWPHEHNLHILLSDFEAIIAPYIEEAVMLAMGLVNNDVRKLILSGQTCHIQQIRNLLDIKLSQREGDSGEKEYVELCFDSTYSKLSTSVGACVTHMLTQKRLNPQGAKEQLRRGEDFVEVNVKNLLFNLPCSFKINQQSDSPKLLFKNQKELKLLEPVSQMGKEIGSSRSDWEEIAPRTEIMRVKKSSKSSSDVQWGTLTLNTYCEQTGYNEQQLADHHLIAQFEVNQHLELFAYLTKKRYINDELIKDGVWSYRANSPFEIINLYECKGLKKESMTLEARERKENAMPPFQIKLNWGHGGNPNSAQELINDKNLFSGHITDPNSASRDIHQALKVKVTSETFDINNSMEIFVAWFGSDEFHHVHTFRRHPLMPDSFPMDYHFTLDALGNISLHEGEVPYLLVDHIEDVFSRPGSVFKQVLGSSTNNSLSEQRDPFSGIH